MGSKTKTTSERLPLVSVLLLLLVNMLESLLARCGAP